MKKPVPEIWRLRLAASGEALNIFETVLERHADVVTWFLPEGDEMDEGDRLDEKESWYLDGYSRSLPDRTALQSELEMAALAMGEDVPSLEIHKIPDMDWVAETLRSFPPIETGRFFVYGSHYDGKIPAGRIGLLVDAGTAFGSGEHATTRGCLLAIEWLSRRNKISRPLDLGCGSGILALAAAKIWPGRIMASDIDPESVRVTRVNAVRNQLRGRLAAVTSDGFRHPAIGSNAPYDLIIANILARPLTYMAPQLAAHLQRGGYAVLSGLLVRQEQQIINAHRRRGMALVKRFRIGDWSALILKKL